MWGDWEEKRLAISYDGHKVGTAPCEVRRQNVFGFAPRLKAEARCALDLSDLPAAIPRPTLSSSFTLSNGEALFGPKDGWRVKELRDEGETGRPRFWLLLETR